MERSQAERSGELFPPRPRGGTRSRLPRLGYPLWLVATLVALLLFLVAIVALIGLGLGLGALGVWMVVMATHAQMPTSLEEGFMLWSMLVFGPFTVLLGLCIVGVLVAQLFAPRTRSEIGMLLPGDAQPKLRAFLDRLAADMKAQCPRLVWLEPEPNAGMRRDYVGLEAKPPELILGLTLIAGLDLLEFKAVLAHEYAHHRQSGARLGHWTHRVIHAFFRTLVTRDRFDAWLLQARNSDNAIRSTFAELLIRAADFVRDTLGRLFHLVLWTERALGRQMEFDADAWAVSEAGSDPPISALWKAERASLAYARTVAIARRLARRGHFARDLFDSYERRLAELDERLAESDGDMAALLLRPYEPGEALHFKVGVERIRDPFDSHPSLHERERAAKRPYVAAAVTDAPSAWALFDDADALRVELSARLYESLGFEAPDTSLDGESFEALIAGEVAAFAHEGRHHGFYTRRVLALAGVEQLVAELEAGAPHTRELAALAPHWRGAALEQHMRLFDASYRDFHTLVAYVRLAPNQRPPAVKLSYGEVWPREIKRCFDQHAHELESLAKARKDADRGLFCWAWLALAPDERGRLLSLAQFLNAIQGWIRHLSGLRTQFEVHIDRVQRQGYARVRVNVDELERNTQAVRAGLAELETIFAAMPRPPIPSLEAGKSVVDYLDLRLPAPADDCLVRAVEIFDVLEDVLARVAELHARAVGAMLELHEQAAKSEASH